MIVAEPNDFTAEIHDRMPVFLTEEQFAPLLSGVGGGWNPKAAPERVSASWPVSKRVKSSKAGTPTTRR
jgi:putative SOS response-associated peptidase YedK